MRRSAIRRTGKSYIEALESRWLLSVSMVKDLNPTTASIGPAFIEGIDDSHALIWTNDELYRSDGTAEGTTPIANGLYPGTDAVAPEAQTAGGLVYFVAGESSTSGSPVWLWRTDGTSNGTFKLAQMPNVQPIQYTWADCNGTLYLGVLVNSTSQLWRSDGTATGTVIVKQFTSDNPPSGMVSYKSKVYFTSDGSEGAGLWCTDGTPVGTTLVVPGPYTNLTAANGLLYFSWHDSTHGTEPWRSDGTAAGTYMLKDLSSISSSWPSGFTPAGSSVVFTANQGQLYVTDGTPTGTHLLVNTISSVSEFTSLGAIAYFDGVQSGIGETVLRSDGTAGGTYPVAPTITMSNISSLAAATDHLYFGTQDADNGSRLWTSDGSAGGTHAIAAIQITGRPGPFYVSGSRIYYLDNDAVYGKEIFVSDGTSAGSHILLDLNTTPNGSNPGGPFGSPAPIAGSTGAVATGNLLYFPALGGLWSTDGTEPTTLLELPSAGIGYGTIQNLSAWNEAIYFGVSGGSTPGIWRFDPATMASVRLTNVVLGNSPDKFVPFNGRLYFLASGELYATDGTSAGTVDVTGASLISPYDLTASGNHLFFAAGSDTELWISDGTATGTYQLKDINPGSDSSEHSSPRDLTNMDGILYFTAQDVTFTQYRSLWRSDGTPSGTFAVAENVALSSPMPGDYGNDDLVSANGALYFAGFSQTNGREIWTSDGTPAGTRMIKDINPATTGNTSSDPRSITSFAGGIYFAAFTPTSGLELWTSDGTNDGTRQVTDINPGQADGLVAPGAQTDPVPIFDGGNSLFLIADDGVTGRELWQTGGTPDSTIRVSDLEPGDSSSNPRLLGLGNSTDGSAIVVFAADSVSNGRELWSVPTAPSPPTAPQWLWANPGTSWSMVGNDLTVDAGLVSLIADPGVSGSKITLDIAAGASAAFDTAQHLGGLNIAGNATVAPGGNKVLVIDSLSIASGGSLDLADNAMIVHSGDAGTWNGSAYDGIAGVVASHAITSSAAHDRDTTLGVATAGDALAISGSQTGSFDGQTVSPGDVLVKFTYVGDANLDGKVNIDDYGRIDGNVAQSGNVFGWYNGDFNMDGKINIDDYGLIDGVIGIQGPIL